jgi:hypothetical protein
MPWHVTLEDEGCPLAEPWGVRQDDSDRLMGCHSSRQDALRQIAALNAEENLAGRLAGDMARQTSRYRALADLDLTPNDGMVTEAERGLKWRDEYGRGGTAVGVARARDISNRVRLSPETVKRMHAYFSRHEVDKQGEGFSPGESGYPSAGRIAWALWGGDPGQRWAASKVEQIRAVEAENR